MINSSNIQNITSKQIEEELKKEISKRKYFKTLSSTIYLLITIAAFSTLVVTLLMPVYK